MRSSIGWPNAQYGNLPDAARDALAPVLGSPSGHRITQVRQVVAQVERRLSDRRMKASTAAISLLDSIREFTTQSGEAGAP